MAPFITVINDTPSIPSIPSIPSPPGPLLGLESVQIMGDLPAASLPPSPSPLVVVLVGEGAGDVSGGRGESVIAPSQPASPPPRGRILTAAQTDNPLPSQSPILVATTVPVIPVIAPPVVTVTPQTLGSPFIVDDNEDTIGSGGFGNTGNTFPNTNSPVIPFQQRPNSIVVPAAVVNTLAPAPPTSDTLPQAAQIQDLNVNPTQPVNPISTIPTDSNPIPTRFPNSPPPPLADSQASGAPASSSSSSSSSPSTLIIILATLSSLVVLGLLIAAFLAWRHRSKSTKQSPRHHWNHVLPHHTTSQKPLPLPSSDTPTDPITVSITPPSPHLPPSPSTASTTAKTIMDQFSRFLSPPSDPAQRSYGQLRTPDDRLLNPVKDRAPTTHRWTPTWGWGSLSMPRSDGTGQRSHTPSGVHLWRTDSSTSSNLHRSDSTSSHLHRVDSSRLVRVDSTTSRLARTDSSTSRPAHPLSRGSTDGASLVRSDSNTSSEGALTFLRVLRGKVGGVKHPTLTTVSGTMKKGDGMLSPTLEE